MARANRHFIPGYIWHLTHRCHKKEFLLKFARDRSSWIELLFEAKSRFSLSVLNFIVTSNHVHLIVSDNGKRDAIPLSMQLIAGRTGQEYNRRKRRNGAFWEDRYHATAVESDKHLWQCMVYVDLNMVRAGVVNHPSLWKWSGYHEIQSPKQRYRIIDHQLLEKLLPGKTQAEIAETHRRWIEEELRSKALERQEHWSQSVAVGTRQFIERIKEQLGFKASGREVRDKGSVYQLRETVLPYNALDKNALGFNRSNTIPWQIEQGTIRFA